MKANPPTKNVYLAAAVMMMSFFLPTIQAGAQFVAYHDFGATTGFESTGNITTHQSSTAAPPVALDLSAKALINYADGSATGVSFSVAGAIGVDVRNEAQTGPPAAGTPADPLFNVAGLNLDNGTIYDQENASPGVTTFTLSGLNPTLLYDVAFYGHRDASQDGLERFTLGGADSATNSSSTGIVSPFVTEQQSRPNATDGHVIRWTDIAPGADGIITVDADPSISGVDNLVYLCAMRLEQLGAAASFAITEIDFSPAPDMVTLTFESMFERIYEIEVSTNLTDWTTHPNSVIGGEGDTTQFTDMNPPAGGEAYYRVRDTGIND